MGNVYVQKQGGRIGGITALEYLIHVEEYSFTEAVEHLINQKGIEKKYTSKIELTEKDIKFITKFDKKNFNVML